MMMTRTERFAKRAVLLTLIPFSILVKPGPVPARQVVLGPEVTVSANKDGGRLRVEPTAILVGEKVVVAWNDSRAGRDFHVETGVGIAWSMSMDGGRSFEFGGYLPAPDEPGGPSGADSWLSAMVNGDILLQLIHWGAGRQDIQIYALTVKAGATWARRGTAVSGVAVDKPAMATVGDNWVGIAYTSAAEIRFVRAIDGGSGWGAPVTISATDTRTRTGASVTACGGEVLVAWLEGKGLVLDEVWSARSADGGKSFAPATQVRMLERGLSPPPGYALGVGPAGFISNNASLTCSGRATPTFHLTYAEGRAAGSVILHQQSHQTRVGMAWGQPEVIAGGDGVWALFPSIAMVGSQIGILHYDSRNSTPLRSVMDTYLYLGVSGSFTSHRLTTVSTGWTETAGDREHAPIQRNFGDYITLASAGRNGVAVWTDGRSGEPRIMLRRFELKP